MAGKFSHQGAYTFLLLFVSLNFAMGAAMSALSKAEEIVQDVDVDFGFVTLSDG